MCVVIRTHLDTRFFPVGKEGRHAPARWRQRRSMHRHTYHSTSASHWCPTPHGSEHILGVRYRSCPCVLETAAGVLCGSLYLYVVCIVSEGGTLILYVRVFRLYSYPSIIYVLTLTPPSGVLAKKKTFVGEQTWLVSPMIDATVVLVYE